MTWMKPSSASRQRRKILLDLGNDEEKENFERKFTDPTA